MEFKQTSLQETINTQSTTLEVENVEKISSNIRTTLERIKEVPDIIINRKQPLQEQYIIITNLVGHFCYLRCINQY